MSFLGAKVKRPFPLNVVLLVRVVGIDNGAYETEKLTKGPQLARQLDVQGHTPSSQRYGSAPTTRGIEAEPGSYECRSDAQAATSACSGGQTTEKRSNTISSSSDHTAPRAALTRSQ